jgi:transposase-like protein
MVMPLIPFEKTPLPFEKTLADGAGTEGGRRPTVVPAPSAASPELGDRPRRRTFAAAEKLRILRQVDDAGPGGIGAVLRREGLYSSLLTDWRRQRDAGAYEALKAVKRGPKVEPVHPLAAEHAQLQRDYKSVTLRLQRAEAIIEIQKKVALLLGLSMPSDEAS